MLVHRRVTPALCRYPFIHLGGGRHRESKGKGKGKGKVTLFNVGSSFSYEAGITGYIYELDIVLLTLKYTARPQLFDDLIKCYPLDDQICMHISVQVCEEGSLRKGIDFPPNIIFTPYFL